MTRDERTANRPSPGGSAFQETGMHDYLTRVAEAVRDAMVAGAKSSIDGMENFDAAAIIASVPRLEPVATQVAVPDGWKQVPVEPTPDMLVAAGTAVHAATYWRSVYRAMLAVAPEAPQTIQCNACDWVGSSADARYLGGRAPLGPLCPERGETTGPADDIISGKGGVA